MNDLNEITNFLLLDERIGTAGQPTAAQLKAVGEAGYEVVVNLAMPDSSGFLEDEAAIVEQMGMEYIALPVVWTAPTVDDVERFFEVMRVHADTRVFVHCAMNMRVSAFMYLYRVTQQGMNELQAHADLQRIWTPNEVWQGLIDGVLKGASE